MWGRHLTTDGHIMAGRGKAQRLRKGLGAETYRDVCLSVHMYKTTGSQELGKGPMSGGVGMYVWLGGL